MSKFAHRHYAAVARVLREANAEGADRDDIVVMLAEMFQRDNPRFKPERFYRACDPAQVPHGADR